MNTAILIVAAGITPLWLAGSVIGYRDRRWMICAGFALAGYGSITSAIAYAGGDLPALADWTAYVARYMATGLIVSAYLNGRQYRRPSRGWKP